MAAGIVYTLIRIMTFPVGTAVSLGGFLPPSVEEGTKGRIRDRQQRRQSSDGPLPSPRSGAAFSVVCDVVKVGDPEFSEAVGAAAVS